uniref:Iron-sulfur cluster carrier protein n=1 Tax=Candidatus Methanophaga sp. ANME-1 ERB7 TaxID=2759913 RepID=A0A7G9Z2I0_9EURY|nr:iron-sulfur cluster carrier protein [Methanosarcinales archaeon ANME-1 ERB7]
MCQKMLNLDNEDPIIKNNKLIPIKFNDNLKVISIAFFFKKTNAIIWRGPIKHNIIKQFLDDVVWGKLDYLVIDFPPGTGDEAISVSQLLNDITGTIIVSTPQEVALLDAIKTINFSKKVNLPVLGLIENMSGEIFGEGSVEETAKKEKIPFLGRLKLKVQIREAGDKGIPFAINGSFNTITDRIQKICNEK